MVDVSKIQPGDKITLGGEFEVQDVDAESGNVRITDHGWWVTSSWITAHHPKPKPLGVGDRVKEGDLIWEIVGPKRSNEAPTYAEVEYPVWRPRWGFASRAAALVESWERVS